MYVIYRNGKKVITYDNLDQAKDMLKSMGLMWDEPTFDLVNNTTGEVLETWAKGECTYIAM